MNDKKKDTIKDSFVHIRISKKEKEFFETKAVEEGINISNYFLFATRAYARFSELKKPRKRDVPGVSEDLLESLSKIEKLILENRSTMKAMQDLSPEEEDYYKVEWSIEKILRLLQEPEFHLKESNTIAAALKKKDPTLDEFLDRTGQRAFSALDIALDRLEGEGKIKIGNKGIITWY